MCMPTMLRPSLHHLRRFISTPLCRHKHQMCQLLHRNALRHCPIIGPSSAGDKQEVCVSLAPSGATMELH
jgi:hypothetical protein